jgi:hypothetical protein
MKCLFFVFIFFMTLSLELGAQSFYDTGSIQKIEITFTQPNWDYQMDTAKAGKEGYLTAQLVKVNGVTFDSVGVKYKGNSSYNPSNNKNPLHIELDTYKDHSYQGYTDIKLGNNYSDPSMIREVLSYQILQKYMDCPASNFAKVYINGAYYGVYSNTESINKKFYGEHFYSRNNTAIKCNPVINPGSATKCNLRYINNDSASYLNYYEIKSDAGWNELVRLCDTVTNYPVSLEQNMDMDRVIWMLAFNNALVNLDSYTGAFCQNYYLYKDDNRRFLPVIWDLNMCFAGFPFVGSGTVSLGSQSVSQLQQMSLNIHSADQHWPLINKVIANSTYKRMYAAHVKTILNEFIASGTFTTLAAQLQAVIDTSVLSDPFKSYSYSQFQNGLTQNVSVGSYSVPGIQTFMNARNLYLQSQTEFTAAAPTVSNVAFGPASPVINSQITVTANISNVNYCYLGYRITNSRKFTKLQMFDDGSHGDGAAGDNIYGAQFTLGGNQAQYYIYAENDNAGTFSPARAEHEFYEIKILPNPVPGQVVINEFLSDNEDDVRNEFNLHEDWIELYNNSNVALSLSNFYLSNAYDTKGKYAFPHSAVIQPNSYLVIWADDIGLTGNQFHANFKLDKDGDQIMLSNGLRTVLDSLSFSQQKKDVSWARCPDGTGAFAALRYPTFGMSNCLVGINERDAEEDECLLFPNPANDYVSLRLTKNATYPMEITNSMGQLIYTGRFSGEMTMHTSKWQAGIYFVKCGKTVKKLIIQH